MRDSGIGIPHYQVDRLFKSFSQVDASITRRYGGTGLGLAICKQLVEMMGGEIGVESREGEGSEFWFTVALEKLAAGSRGEAILPEDIRGVRVLVVDDHATNRLVFRELLRSWGCRFEERTVWFSVSCFVPGGAGSRRHPADSRRSSGSDRLRERETLSGSSCSICRCRAWMEEPWARRSRPTLCLWSFVQPDLLKQEYDFSQYHQQYEDVPEGITILANIAPAGNNDTGYTMPGSYLPVDTDQYVAFVTAVVERYDGDGIDDMPGLTTPIKYWQVGNEPSEQRATDFAELQRITYTAIKEACSECKVLIGGVAGIPPANAYITDFDKNYKPILDALNGKYVDIMDIH